MNRPNRLIPWPSVATLDRALPWLGALLLAQFIVMAAIKVSKGLGADILWLSHMGLVFGGLGLILRQPWLVAATITGIFIIHGLWVADVVAWMLTGHFPLAMSDYMAAAPASTWISTSHHFYLVPILLIAFVRWRRFPVSALPAALGMFLALSIAARLFTPADRNVNCAFTVDVGPQIGLVRWLNSLEGAIYLLALNALVSLVLFVPVALVLGGLSWWMRRRPRVG